MNSGRPGYDVAIIGGGLVGASLARALSHLPIRLVLVEAVNYRGDQPPSFDDRIIALSQGSRRIFDNLGLWSRLGPVTTPIKHIHVSEQGRFGFTRLNAEDEGVDALGYVVTARELGKHLVQDLDQQDNLQIFQPARVSALQLRPEYARLSLSMAEQSQELDVRLVIAADGGDSTVRQLLNLEVREEAYRQTAIVANLSCSRAHANVAYERFTHQGPLAMLPIDSHQAGMVWTVNSSRVNQLMEMDAEAFLSILQREFGRRLGHFLKLGTRHSYDLKLVRVKRATQRRLALIGNAAHTLHPVAGQGFNLGIRDAAVMANVLAEAVAQNIDPGCDSVLERYEQWRRRDQNTVIGFTHGLIKTFSNNLGPLAVARNLGLIATDLCPPLKHGLARTSMGLAGHLPQLALK